MATSKSEKTVLAAAENVFAQKGFDGARMDEIARKAGVNKALIYYYFPSKERLFRAVLDDFFGALQQTIEAVALSAEPPAHRFFRMVTAYFDFVDGRRTYPQIVQRETIGRGRFFKAIAGHIEPMYRLSTQLISECVRRGLFHRADPGHLILSVVGLIVFYFNSARLFGMVARTDALSQEAVALRKREIIELLHRGLLTERGRKETFQAGVS